MPRPCCQRLVGAAPPSSFFKPAGVPLAGIPVVEMTLDELEAIRLADLDGLYQEAAAARMGVSRPTFGRIVESARRKVAEALVHGKGLRIEGGPVAARPRHGHGPRCGRRRAPGGQPDGCPRCSGEPARREPGRDGDAAKEKDRS